MTTRSGLESIQQAARQNKWLQRFTILTRILLALGFTPSGSIYLLCWDYDKLKYILKKSNMAEAQPPKFFPNG